MKTAATVHHSTPDVTFTLERVRLVREATLAYCATCREPLVGNAFWDWTRTVAMHQRRGPQHHIWRMRLTHVTPRRPLDG